VFQLTSVYSMHTHIGRQLKRNTKRPDDHNGFINMIHPGVKQAGSDAHYSYRLIGVSALTQRRQYSICKWESIHCKLGTTACKSVELRVNERVSDDHYILVTRLLTQGIHYFFAIPYMPDGRWISYGTKRISDYSCLLLLLLLRRIEQQLIRLLTVFHDMWS
jgi:hypothetical protein